MKYSHLHHEESCSSDVEAKEEELEEEGENE